MKTPRDYRLEILEKLKNIVCKDRIKDYGDAEDNFRHIAARWSLYLNHRYGISAQIKAHDVAVMMADVKITRIAATPNHQDSWDDLAGYAVCGGGIVTKDNDTSIITAVPEHYAEISGNKFTAGEVHAQAIEKAQQRVSRGTILE